MFRGGAAGVDEILLLRGICSEPGWLFCDHPSAAIPKKPPKPASNATHILQIGKNRLIPRS
jgi:hypothetical protein